MLLQLHPEALQSYEGRLEKFQLEATVMCYYHPGVSLESRLGRLPLQEVQGRQPSPRALGGV